MSNFRGYPNAGHYYSNIVKPIEIDCNFVVDAANGNGFGVRSVKSNGYIENIFMHTTATPGAGPNGFVNPNPASGYALIQFKSNFNKYLGGFSGFVSPSTGAPIAISGAGLTVGIPYIIASVGATPAAKFTVTTIADVAGASAGKYFTATDVFSNNYVFYNVVSGVGIAPALVGPLAGYIAVPVAYASGAANSAVATAVALSMAGVNGGNSFTAVAALAVVTVTNAGPAGLQFPLTAVAQTSGFTIGAVVYTTIQADWQHVGLPKGFAPAVGQSFIATATGGSVGTGTVVAIGTSGIAAVEVLGDANQMIANQSLASNAGAIVMVQFLSGAAAVTAPTAGSVIGMTFKFDGSQVTVDGL